MSVAFRADQKNEYSCDLEQIAKKYHKTHDQAAHVMLFCKEITPIADNMELRDVDWQLPHTIIMQMRFDGTIGFPGGYVEDEEHICQSLTRELAEEHGLGAELIEVDRTDYLYSCALSERKLVLHFFCKEISLSQLDSLEKHSVTARDHGSEVLGVIRVPFIGFQKTRGLAQFMKHNFIGISREQLLNGITTKKLLPEDLLSNIVA